MVKEYYAIEIQGRDFDPIKVEQIINFKFNNTINPGEIGLRGRYKGIPTPYGSATIVMPNDNEKLLSLLQYLQSIISHIRSHGADDIVLYGVYAYKGQCNCELGIEEIRLLAELKIPFIFSVYEDKKLFCE